MTTWVGKSKGLLEAQEVVGHQMLDHLLGREQVGLQPVASDMEEVIDLGIQLPFTLVPPEVEGIGGATLTEPTAGRNLGMEDGVVNGLFCGKCMEPVPCCAILSKVAR